MPFDLTGGTGADRSTSTLRVDPAQVLSLKAELQPVHDEVEDFLRTKGRTMAMRPPGADPVSVETAEAFNECAQSAIDAAWGYLTQLKNVLGALDKAAKTYNLVEDTNTRAFGRGTP